MSISVAVLDFFFGSSVAVSEEAVLDLFVMRQPHIRVQENRETHQNRRLRFLMCGRAS